MSSILTQHSQDGPDSKGYPNREHDYPAYRGPTGPVADVRHSAAENSCKSDGREYLPSRGDRLGLPLRRHTSTFPQTASQTSSPLHALVVHHGDNQTRQTVDCSEYSDGYTRAQKRCCLPIVVDDAECPDQTQYPTRELSTPNMLCRSRWERSHRER